MDNKIGVISEVIVLIVNVLIFMRMTVLKKDTLATRMIMYIGSAMILGVFFVCTYTGLLPEALGSFVCVTIPSFTLFFILSKYKDFRFFVTFCFIDTVTMVLTFFSRMIGLMGGAIATVISGIAVCLVMLLIYFTGAPYFKRYRELMENVEGGWGTTAIATLLIYGLLIFTASYPKPLVERQEYLLPYAFLSITILSFYVVFIRTLLQRKALSDLNAQLMQEMQWHEIAYSDGLTGLGNRMAYMEQVSKVERTAEESACIYVVVIDINNFKRINDTLGHHVGDRTLKNVADQLNRIFAEECYMTFRIGGDEFAVISNGVTAELLEEKIAALKELSMNSELECSLSVGYAKANLTQNNAMENAFVRADSIMYEEKMKLQRV